MPTISTPPHDVLNSLKAVLLAGRPDAANTRTAILTTSPELWADTELGEHTLISDLSSLLGTSVQISIGSEISIVRQALLRAGWPSSALVEEYRPDLKTPIVFDIAVLVEDQLVLAVEIKRNLIEHGRRLREFRAKANGLAKFICITDGNQYHWLGDEPTVRGPNSTSSAPPSPSDLEIDSLPNSAEAAQAGIVPIQNWQTAQERIANFKPEYIAIDFTFPSGLSDSESTGELEALRLHTRELIPLPTRDVSTLLLAWIIGSQQAKRVAALTSAATASMQSSRSFRELAAQRLPLLAAVDLAAGASRHLPLANYMAFFFGENRDQTYFDLVGSSGDLSNLGEQLWFTSLRSWLAGQPISTGFLQKTSPDSWSPSAYHPELRNIRERLARLGELKDLGDVCEVRLGPMLRNITDDPNTGDIVIQGRSLRGTTLDLQDASRTTDDNIPDWAYAQRGDVLLPQVWGSSSAAVIFAESFPAVISRSVIVIRVTDERLAPEQIAEYLNSPAARRLVGAFASRLHNVERIVPSELKKLPIPIVEPSTFRNIAQVRVVEELLQAQMEKLMSLRRSLFDSKDRATFFDSIDQLKNRSDVLSRSIADIDRPQFRISNFYPFPIAYGYRLLDGILPSSDLYREQLRVGENLLAFVASVCLSLIQPADRHSTGIDLKSYWQGGISPGHWKDMIARCSKVLSSYKDHPLAAGIARLNIGSEARGVGKDVQAIIRSKNDFKHDRGPTTETDIIAATREMSAILERLMISLGFFTEYPIRQVIDMNSGRHAATIALRCLVFAGDHPGLRHEEVKHSKPLTKGDLYLDLRNGVWVPLFPFITALNCPRCRVREAYFIDRWPGGDAPAILKSFERGHTEEIKDVADELLRWSGVE
jgi:hypothetical protein